MVRNNIYHKSSAYLIDEQKVSKLEVLSADRTILVAQVGYRIEHHNTVYDI